MNKQEVRAVAQEMAVIIPAGLALITVMAAGVVLIERGSWAGTAIIAALIATLVAAAVAVWWRWLR